MEERNYWLGFSALPGIGPAKFRKLLEEYKTAKSAWEAVGRRPTRLIGLIGEETAGKLEEFRKKFSIENYLKQLKEKNVWFVTLLDEEYPQILKEIKNPPFVLYGKGDRRLLPRSTIAVVGSRKTTEYGREVTKLLTTDLVLAGFTIISGLALGVDAISHMIALENNGKTIAVLGCGVDCCYPRENQSIYNSILKNGSCIVSEFPLGMKPTQWTFPARNRIIAGLSQAVLVTEGAEDSGSLITANFALKFNRKVFAVPGPITSSMSKGPYKLIAKGAKLVTTAEDILIELKTQSSSVPREGKLKTTAQSSKVWNATKEELVILKILENEALHFDEIVRKTDFPSAKLSSLLSLMEIKGMVRGLGGGTFKINFR